MLELKPTLATALLGAGGELLHVFPAMPFDPAKATQGYVPCLILPAPRPIEQRPEEWKDGRRVLVCIHGWWVEVEWREASCIWMGARGNFYSEFGPTHIMLPPPAPKEAQDAR